MVSPQPKENEPVSPWRQAGASAAPDKAPRPRAERRIHPRVLFSVPVKLHHLAPGGISTSRGITLDLSEGGLGALIQIDLIIGEAVEIDLQLPACSLSTVAVVRYCNRVRAGFEFVGLSSDERQQISSALGTKQPAPFL